MNADPTAPSEGLQVRSLSAWRRLIHGNAAVGTRLPVEEATPLKPLPESQSAQYHMRGVLREKSRDCAGERAIKYLGLFSKLTSDRLEYGLQRFPLKDLNNL